MRRHENGPNTRVGLGRVSCNMGYLSRFLTIYFHSTQENALIAVVVLSLGRVQSFRCKKTYGVNDSDSRELGSYDIKKFIKIVSTI